MSAGRATKLLTPGQLIVDVIKGECARWHKKKPEAQERALRECPFWLLAATPAMQRKVGFDPERVGQLVRKDCAEQFALILEKVEAQNGDDPSGLLGTAEEAEAATLLEECRDGS